MTDNINLNLSNLTSSQLHQIMLIMQDTDAESPNTINELKEMLMKSKRKEIIDELIRTTYDPKQGKNGYFWRPIKGRDDIQVRGKTKEELFEKAIKKYLALQNQYTLLEVLELCNDSRKDITEDTKLRKVQYLKAWLPDLINKPISDIKNHELYQAYEKHVVEAKGKMTRANCRNINCVLRRTFEYANEVLKQDTIDIEKAIKSFRNINPKLFAGNTTLVIGMNPAHRLTRDEVKLVVKYCNENQNIYTCAILFAIYSGARVSEVCGLLKSDIDFDNSLINVSHALKRDYSLEDPKEHKVRVIPLPNKAINALKTALELSPEDSPYVFYHKAPRMNTDMLTTSQLNHYLTKHIEKPLGIKNKRMHSLRKTYASMLGESDIHHALRELLLGHELTGLDRCYDVDATPIPEIVKKLNKIFADY